MAADSSAGLKERIVNYLRIQYRKTDVNSPVPWRTIWIEMGVTEEDFEKALQAAGEDIVRVDADHIKLARHRLD